MSAEKAAYSKAGFTVVEDAARADVQIVMGLKKGRSVGYTTYAIYDIRHRCLVYSTVEMEAIHHFVRSVPITRGKGDVFTARWPFFDVPYDVYNGLLRPDRGRPQLRAVVTTNPPKKLERIYTKIRNLGVDIAADLDQADVSIDFTSGFKRTQTRTGNEVEFFVLYRWSMTVSEAAKPEIVLLPEFKSEAQQFELSAFVEEHFVRCPVS